MDTNKPIAVVSPYGKSKKRIITDITTIVGNSAKYVKSSDLINLSKWYTKDLKYVIIKFSKDFPQFVPQMMSLIYDEQFYINKGNGYIITPQLKFIILAKKDPVLALNIEMRTISLSKNEILTWIQL